ncbi:hypothetical protein CANARDRAFT_174941 [[Candida] arabinofermentans NRRL YB-2248]|uniref:Major facilitator superfamily (MFS) profile domain-containing protein n=1 Tax=[Candida] arabinofermentans NRRL YB-2248 TaxID=983967 RepID=A0A1E4T582_9ASCO|nr:hypothetical protein CANARDRAFT_174941 [[Candida] arabinofermentans NRRL YB-2248]
MAPSLNKKSSQTTLVITESTSSLLDSQITKPSPLVLALTILASISGFMFGYDTGYVSSVLVSVGTDLENRYLTLVEKEWITSATSLGALVASLMAGTLADVYGRKKTIVLCNILFVIGATLQMLTHTVKLMIIGRLVMGLGVGMGSLIAPLYIGELAPGKFRGRLVIINCLAITGGQLIAYGIGAGLSKTDSGWRYIISLSLIPCIIQLFAFVFLPDTPRYLISKGCHKEAHAVLKKVYPSSTSDLIDANILELQMLNSLIPGSTELQKMRNGLIELFSAPSNKRALVIGCGLQAIQQITGFNSLMFFSSSIFKMVGYDDPTLVSCIIAGTNFIFTVVALFIIDKVGRRKILLISMPLLLISQLVCALAFKKLDVKIENNSLNSELTKLDGWGYLVMFGLVSFVAFYAIGLGNVPWQQAELFPQSVRGLGTSFATATNWLGSMIVSSTFLSLMKYLTPCGTFLTFGGITFFSFLFVVFVYPELSSLQLEEVQSLLHDGFNVQLSNAQTYDHELAQLLNDY